MASAVHGSEQQQLYNSVWVVMPLSSSSQAGVSASASRQPPNPTRCETEHQTLFSNLPKIVLGPLASAVYGQTPRLEQKKVSLFHLRKPPITAAKDDGSSSTRSPIQRNQRIKACRYGLGKPLNLHLRMAMTIHLAS